MDLGRLRFYVYELIDPRDGSIFYVGKGKAGRAWQHEADVRSGRPPKNWRKHRRIEEILSAGVSVEVRIVAYYEDEAEAYSHEVELIASLSGLTNIAAGGRGGWSLTKEEAMRRLELRPARLARAKMVKDRKWLSSWLSMADKWGAVTVHGMDNGDEVGRDFVRMVRGIVSAPPPEPIKY